MITLDLVQGTSNWLAARAKHFTASEAPAMLGLSKYKTRTELLREKATGIIDEVDEATQRRFNAGHEAESATRAWAEAFAGEELYPVTGAIKIDELPLLASFDGLTMDESICWENKLWNAAFAEQVRCGVAPDTHWPQLEQQMLVSGARNVLFTVSDGADNIVSMWYESIPERRARVIAGWKQFAIDLNNYQHAEVIPAAIATAQMSLPSVSIRVDGSIALVDNLGVFGDALTAYVERINKKPETDQDFADLEATEKTLKRAEEELDAAENSAIGQVISVDTMRKTVALYRNMARDNRLFVGKLVKAEKENRKAALVASAMAEFRNHLYSLESRIGGAWMPRQESFNPAADVTRGLKTLDSMRDRLSVWLANSKVQANEIADRIELNHKSVTDPTLAPDFGAICQKSPDDFAALIGMRKLQRDAAEEKRIDAERIRIRAEEQAKAEAEAHSIAVMRAAEMASIEAARIAAANKEAINDALAAQRVEREKQSLIASVVIEHQDEISAFMASRDFKTDAGKVRAILVEFVKFQSTHQPILEAA